VWEVHVDETLEEYIVRLVDATRQHPSLRWASPRASLALYKSAQALAALRGRDHVLPDDLKYLALWTLTHRLIVNPEAELRGHTAGASCRRSSLKPRSTWRPREPEAGMGRRFFFFLLVLLAAAIFLVEDFVFVLLYLFIGVYLVGRWWAPGRSRASRRSGISNAGLSWASRCGCACSSKM